MKKKHTEKEPELISDGKGGFLVKCACCDKTTPISKEELLEMAVRVGITGKSKKLSPAAREQIKKNL